MKLFAQHGAQEGDKINEGLSRGLLDGVIYSPRDVSLANLCAKLDFLEQNHATVERLVDPQYYSIFLNATQEARLGYLLEDYGDYFQPRRRGQLERENQIQKDLTAALTFQAGLKVTRLIAPNILIPNSLNSIEAVIAKNFIRLAASQHQALGDTRPLFVTLAISRNALGDKQDLVEFLNEITLLDDPPQGFYVLISARNSEARSDIYNMDVIANWMFINHVLTLNGFEVFNGYSDILTPFLGAAGGAAGALGWWSNLRAFSLNRFAPSPGGGRLPIQRYISQALLNRITYFELDQLRGLLPGVLNNLPTDNLYDATNGSEPQRNLEVVQSWDAVKALNQSLATGGQRQSLNKCQEAVVKAEAFYDTIQNQPIRLDSKSNAEHLQPLAEGIRLFEKLAELD
ncbi:MAG TPA: hypothetical protein P5186_13815 [Candidatus Paceibacterota bacterium]|nr:hypothetical protein [Verrucomicrobiota bacterium]HRY49120.1 hypothetical protein [Candidatus Paceibacterota bacterium]